jgi:eukaryotic-like serine/threonine-protein kinase
MDIYSAGVLFYELAAFEWPVHPQPGDNSPLAWRNAHLLTPPKDLKAARRDLPVGLVQLILLMLQKDPPKRPQTWQAVVDRLGATSNPPAGRRDVTALVSRATESLARRTEAEVREREARERKAERSALLEQAFTEPAEILKGLVGAYNDATMTDKMAIVESSRMGVEVQSPTRHASLTLEGTITDGYSGRRSGSPHRAGSSEPASNI